MGQSPTGFHFEERLHFVFMVVHKPPQLKSEFQIAVTQQ